MPRNYSFPYKAQLYRAWRLKKRGFTDEEIARTLGVSIHWFKLRKATFAAFFERRLQMEAEIAEKNWESRSRSAPILTDDARIRLIDAVAYGLDINQALNIIGISSATYHALCQMDPSLQAAMETARANLDIDVVKSLYRRAKGLQIQNESETIIRDRRGNVLTNTASRQTRTLPPSVAAAEFWLTNRQAWYKTSQKPSVNIDDKQTEFDVVSNLYEGEKEEEKAGGDNGE